MPSVEHEAPLELVRDHPDLVPDLLTCALGVQLPEWRHVELGTNDLSAILPTELRADAVVVMGYECESDGPADISVEPSEALADAPSDAPSDAREQHSSPKVAAVVVEVQRSPDEDKRLSWLAYLGNLRVRYRCPVFLLVIAIEPSVAKWCAKPITIGHPGLVLTPIVAGPTTIPHVTDVEAAREDPTLGVLSAMTHGDDPETGRQVLYAMWAGLEKLPDDQAELYADLVHEVLSEAAGAYLENLMTTGTREYRSDFARRYFGQGEARGEARGEAKGEAKGESRALLAVLAARGLPVADEAYERITACTDLDQLHTWIQRAATATTTDEIFAD